MNVRSYSCLAGIAGVLTSLAASCSIYDDGNDGVGSGGSAGSAGSGGSAGNSGSAGTGGSAGSGGSAGAGGVGGSAGSAGSVGTGGSAGSGGAGAQTTLFSFADDILPILQAECGECHGAFVPFASTDEQEAYATATEMSFYGGEDQPRYDVIVQRLQDGSMPPQCGGGAPGSNADCVTLEDFQTIRDWANGGDPPPP